MTDMTPKFTDAASYRKWRSDWAAMYSELSKRIRDRKNEVKNAMRRGHLGTAANAQRELIWDRAAGRKTMALLEDAKVLRDSILEARRKLDEQNATFPLTIENASNIEFHFNKKSLQLDFIPMWALKAKGKTYYVKHVECAAPWTTRERPDHPSTKGSIRIKRGTIHIDSEGGASIS